MKKYFFIAVVLTIQSAYSMIGGSVAVDTEKNGIFNIVVTNPSDQTDNSLCTATKVGANLILTAAHCFDSNQKPAWIGYNLAIQNPDYIFDGLIVREVIIHPSYQVKKDFSSLESDVALVIVDPDYHFSSLASYEIDFNDPKKGEGVEFWGYGCQRHVDKINDYSPLKKIGSSTIQGQEALMEDFGTATAEIQMSSKKIYGSHHLTLGKGLDSKKPSVCHGDSGGPLLINGKIIGVNVSYLTKFSNVKGHSKTGLANINLHARLSVIKDWLLEKMN